MCGKHVAGEIPRRSPVVDAGGVHGLQRSPTVPRVKVDRPDPLGHHDHFVTQPDCVEAVSLTQ